MLDIINYIDNILEFWSESKESSQENAQVLVWPQVENLNGSEVHYYLFISNLLFIFGMLGVMVIRHNIFVILISLEVMILGLILDFITIATINHQFDGIIFIFIILTIAVVESAIGLALLINYCRLFRTASVKHLNE